MKNASADMREIYGGISTANAHTSTTTISYDNSQMSQQPPPPPTYEQATSIPNISSKTTANNSAAYPAVEVLPTPPEHTLRRPERIRETEMQTAYVNVPPAASTYISTTNATYYHTQPRVFSPPPPPFVTIAQQAPFVVIQQPRVLPLGPEPVYMICPACHTQKLTRIEYQPSSRTHLMAALLCVLGLWCCVCLPYCAGSCMNADHYCSNCNKYLGTYGK